MKKLLITAIFVYLALTNLKAQDNYSANPVLSPIASPSALPSEIFRFKPGFFSQRQAETIGGTTTADQWRMSGSLGTIANQSSFYGTHNYSFQNSLFTGLQSGTPVIRYGSFNNGSNNTSGIPLSPDLEFQAFVNGGNASAGNATVTPLVISGGNPQSTTAFAVYAKERFMGQLQNGEFGNIFGTNNQWAAIGTPSFSNNLYGLRIQRAARGLTLGYQSAPLSGFTNNSTPFLEWIGNLDESTTPGTFEFRYAKSPVGGAAQRISAMSIEPISIDNLDGANVYNYKGLLGQSQTGTFGNVGVTNSWIGFGKAPLPAGSPDIYGGRIQKDGYGLLMNIRNDMNGTKKSYIEYGTDPSLSSLNNFDLIFRAYKDDADFSTTPSTLALKSNGNSVFGEETFPTSAKVSVFSPKFQNGIFTNTVNGYGLRTNAFNEGGILAITTGNNEFGGQYAGVEGRASGAKEQNFGVIGIANDAVAPVAPFSYYKNNYGVRGYGINGENAIGVQAIAESGVNNNLALWAYTNNNSGLYNNFAAYFEGNTMTTGTAFTMSDKNYKTDIKSEINILEKIKKLNPINYYYDIKENNTLGLSNKLQHGFLSQEIEVIFPELVKDMNLPKNDSKNTQIGYEKIKAMNYNGLISILTKGIQELYQKVETLEKQLAEKQTETFVLNKQISSLEERKTLEEKGYMLAQNVPNPFSENTTIKYSLPNTNDKAIIAIFDMNGRMLQQFNLTTGKGQNQITVNGNSLTAGMYLYTLLVNGEEVVTKRMVLTR